MSIDDRARSITLESTSRNRAHGLPRPYLPAEQASMIQRISAREFLRLWSELLPGDRAPVLRVRCQTDRELFARTTFPDRFALDWSPVHLAFLGVAKRPWRERQHQLWRAWVAPRGAAKSSFLSFLDVLHDIVYGYEACVGMFSTSFQLSEGLVEDLYTVLTRPDSSPELHDVWGPFKMSGPKTQFVARCPEGDRLGTQVVAFSFGGTVRGHKHAGVRPTKFVLDDTVHPKHVKSGQQRDDAWAFLQKDIGRAGDRHTMIELAGTIQRDDDLVARAAKSARFVTHAWRNLITWPARMDLWEECRRVWADLGNHDREQAARAFYAAHRSDMDAGAKVLWPEGRPLFDLMLTFWSDPAAFWSEDQNTPRNPDVALFEIERIRRCRWDGKVIHTARGTQVPIADCQVAIWLDPSAGGIKSDIPAIAVVARDRDGWRYWLGCQVAQRRPSAQHEALWSTWEHWLGCGVKPAVGVDVTGTQGNLDESFERQRETRRRAGKPWQMPLTRHTFSDDKIARLATLEPVLHNGWMELATDLPGEALDQVRDFPTGLHDDCLDAAERADWLLQGGGIGSVVFTQTLRG